MDIFELCGQTMMCHKSISSHNDVLNRREERPEFGVVLDAGQITTAHLFARYDRGPACSAAQEPPGFAPSSVSSVPRNFDVEQIETVDEFTISGAFGFSSNKDPIENLEEPEEDIHYSATNNEDARDWLQFPVQWFNSDQDDKNDKPEEVRFNLDISPITNWQVINDQGMLEDCEAFGGDPTTKTWHLWSPGGDFAKDQSFDFPPPTSANCIYENNQHRSVSIDIEITLDFTNTKTNERDTATQILTVEVFFHNF